MSSTSPSPSPFFMYDVTSGDPFPQLRFLKKTVFEIKGPSLSDDSSQSLSQAPDFYMKCNESLRIRFGFQGGQYSAENEGTVVIYASQALGEAVMAVDAQVKEYFIENFAKTRSNFGNAVWTEAAVHNMFRMSLWESSLRCKVTREKTDFFDSHTQKLNYFIGCNRIQRNTNVSLVVSPTCVWFKDHKLGVSWTARQIMCNVPDPSAAVFDYESPIVEEIEQVYASVDVDVTWSLRSDDDEPSEPNDKPNDEPNKVVSTMWSINSLIEDEDNHIQATTSKKIVISKPDSWSLLDLIDEDTQSTTSKPVTMSKSDSWSILDMISDEEVIQDETETHISSTIQPEKVVVSVKKRKKKIIVKKKQVT